MQPGVWNESKSLFCNNNKRNLISTLFWLDLIVLPFKKYYEPHIFCLQNHVVTLKSAMLTLKIHCLRHERRTNEDRHGSESRQKGMCLVHL